MTPTIELLTSYGDVSSPLLAAAIAIAIVLGALTRLVKAMHPILRERQRTRRAIVTERERTLRASTVSFGVRGRVAATGPAAHLVPKATVEPPHAGVASE